MATVTDYHVLTEFSDDSIYQMEQVVKDAIEQRMEEICFTDHVDYGIKADHDKEPFRFEQGLPLTNVVYPRCAESVLSLKEKYADKITIALAWNSACRKTKSNAITSCLHAIRLISFCFPSMPSIIRVSGMRNTRRENAG